jgi:phage gp45-like
MINISKVISFSFDSLKRQLVKVYRLGKDDVQEAIQAAPFGVDSSPINDMQAIFMQTGERGKTVIVGYLNRNHISEKGETRIYSTNESGSVQIFLHLKNNGTAEFGGDTDNLVRFSKLEEGFNQLKSDFNNFLIHTHPASGSPPAPPALPSTASIAGSKIDKIKTL